MPPRPRFTQDVEFLFGRLETYHGINRRLAGERLHHLKAQSGRAAQFFKVGMASGRYFEKPRGFTPSARLGTSLMMLQTSPKLKH